MTDFDQIPAHRRLLIVSADDFGLSPGVCEAILQAGEHGIVTSVSALVVAPAWDSYASRLESSGLGVGAHLCLVGEDPPLLTGDEVPTLVDSAGRLFPSWRQLILAVVRGRVDLDDVRRECGAQLEKLAQSGIVASHFDAHQHVHLWPQLSHTLLSLAAEHSIDAVRATDAEGFTPRAVAVRGLGALFDRRVRRSGFVAPAASRGFDDAGKLSLPNLVRTIDGLGALRGSSAEIGSHPGLADDPDRARYDWGYSWSEEFDALCSPAALDAVRRNGFELGTFADLKQHGEVHRAGD